MATGASSDGSGTDGMALLGKGGFQKLGAGLLVVNGDTLLGVDANGIPTTSEFPGSGDIQLDAGNSAWNGTITLTNGSINVTSGQHSFNGLISITNGHLTNANSLVAFTKAGQNFTVELQQSGASAQTLFGNLNQVPADGAQVYTGPITVGTITGGVFNPGGGITINGSIDFGTSTTGESGRPDAGHALADLHGQLELHPDDPLLRAGHAGVERHDHPLPQHALQRYADPRPAASAVNLVTNGIGHTTFNNGVVLVNGSSLTLTDTSFTLPYTQAAGTLTLNGLDTFNKNGSGTAGAHHHRRHVRARPAPGGRSASTACATPSTAT